MKIFAKIQLTFLLVLLTTYLSFFNLVRAEALEPTPLPSQENSLNITYFNIPSGGRALQIIKGSDNNLWFTIDKTGERAIGIDGKVTNPVVGAIGRITPNGDFSEFPLSGSAYTYFDGEYVDSVSFAITKGPDGNIWFTEAEANKIGKITTQGQITEYLLADNGMQPRSITEGPDGNIWLITSGSNGSKVLSIKTDGSINKQISIPGYIYGHSLTFDSNGNLWFRGSNLFSLGRLTQTGDYKEFSTNAIPVELLSGTDNNLWFGQNGAYISRITNEGTITDYAASGEAWNLIMNVDNTIWFTELHPKSIKMIDPIGGNITTYPLSEPGQFGLLAADLTYGPDSNIWFTSGSRIGRINVVTPTQSPSIMPSVEPTTIPTATTTPEPTAINPTPTITPIPSTTIKSTIAPSPTNVPETTPTIYPTDVPTNAPTPTSTPTEEPTNTPVPTSTPSPVPTANPTVEPTVVPTQEPTVTTTPTPEPTIIPTPTETPVLTPTATPIPTPTPIPTVTPDQTNVKPAIVQSNFKVNKWSNSNTQSFTSNVKAGNLILVAVTNWTAGLTSINDNKGNTYVPVASSHATSANDYVHLYYAKSVTEGQTTVSVKFNGSSANNVGIYEFSGLSKTDPIDQVISNTGRSTTPNGGTLTASTDNQLYFVVGVDEWGKNKAASTGNGYTLLNQQSDAKSNERFYTEYRTSPKGRYKTDFKIASASPWAVLAVSLKPASN